MVSRVRVEVAKNMFGDWVNKNFSSFIYFVFLLVYLFLPVLVLVQFVASTSKLDVTNKL